MKILVYFPTNARAIDQISVMEMFIKSGHEVYLLTQTEKGNLHYLSEKLGVKTYSYSIRKTNPFSFYIKHAFFLIKFCHHHRIDIIFSHLHDTGITCVLAKPFLKARTFFVRHNTDEGKLLSPKKSFVINLIINTFSTNIIAPSKAVYRYLVEVEKVSPKKLHLINYGYNFDMYKVDKIGIASEIRQKYQCKMLILSVCRLISVKRHNLMLEVVESLLKKGLDVKWICLGTGDLLQHYQRLVKEKGLSDRIYFLGFQKNVADFMEAADVFLHLSETEASNSAVKEAGLEKLAVIVCEKVGDFEDYIETGKNGFLVNKENPVPEAISCLEELYQNPDKTKTIGENLYRKVLEEFSIEKVKPKYEELLKKVI